MFNKKLIAGIFVAIVMTVPFTAKAVSIADLQAQISSLLAVVASLQQQLSQTVGGGTVTPVPAIQCENFTYNLYLGKRDNATNDEVTKLQRFLTKTGDYNSLVGGYFGPATERAVQSWQRKHNVVSSGTPDSTGYGVVGPITRGKMRCGTVVPIPPYTSIPTNGSGGQAQPDIEIASPSQHARLYKGIPFVVSWKQRGLEGKVINITIKDDKVEKHLATLVPASKGSATVTINNDHLGQLVRDEATLKIWVTNVRDGSTWSLVQDTIRVNVLEQKQDVGKSPWGKKLVKNKNEIPNGKFRAYYVDKNNPSIKKGTEIVDRPSYRFLSNSPQGISSKSFGAYWVGLFDFDNAKEMVFEIAQQNSKTRIYVDGQLVTTASRQKRVPHTFSAGTHMVEVEHENARHTMETMVRFAENTSLISHASIKDKLAKDYGSGLALLYGGVYESKERYGKVDVSLKNVTTASVLVLESFEGVVWNLKGELPIGLKAIVVSSRLLGSEVIGNRGVPVYRLERGTLSSKPWVGGAGTAAKIGAGQNIHHASAYATESITIDALIPVWNEASVTTNNQLASI